MTQGISISRAPHSSICPSPCPYQPDSADSIKNYPSPHPQLRPLSPEPMPGDSLPQPGFSTEAFAAMEQLHLSRARTTDGIPDPSPGSQIPSTPHHYLGCLASLPGWLLDLAPLSPFRSCFPCILLLPLLVPNNSPNITNDHSDYILRHIYSASCPAPHHQKLSLTLDSGAGWKNPWKQYYLWHFKWVWVTLSLVPWLSNQMAAQWFLAFLCPIARATVYIFF